MLSFLRPDLVQFNGYTPHPEADARLLNNFDQFDQLDTNEYPEDLPATLKQKLAWAYQQEIAANRYPDGAYTDLKQAIAQYVNESATTVTTMGSEHISVGNGSDELIRSLLIATCLGGQGSIMVANPTFSMYGILARTLGIPVVGIKRTQAFELDLTEAKAALVQSILCPVRVVFMVHPNSPTGNPLTKAEIEWLLQLPSQILVVIDEAYFEFSGQTLVSELNHRPNWVILRTFSKAFRLAAHRVGYAIAHPDFIQVLEKVRLPYNLPAMTQVAARVALAHRQVLLQDIPTLIQERERVYAQLNQNTCLKLWPSSANFIYAQADTPAMATDFSRQLKQQGTSIRLTGGGLRITIGTPNENNRTIARIQQILTHK